MNKCPLDCWPEKAIKYRNSGLHLSIIFSFYSNSANAADNKQMRKFQHLMVQMMKIA